jgi:hypothetical protein
VHISFSSSKTLDCFQTVQTEIDVKQIGATAVQDLREGSENEMS